MILLPASYKDVRGYEDAGGKFLPACGSILDLLFPSKMEWIDEKYLEEGTRCHELMKVACDVAKINGAWPECADHRVQALIDHLSAWNFFPVEAETPRASLMYGYAGTPDALMMRGDLYVVPDWKFAESIDQRYYYQLESYQPFFHELPTKPTLMIWQVKRDCTVKPIAVRPNAIRRAEFLAALTVMKKRLR